MLMLTVKQAAKRLKYSERTIRDRLSTGKLHGQKMGRQWRISDEAIRLFEKSLEPGQPPEETTSPEAVHPSPQETSQSTTKDHDDHLDDIRNLLLDWQRELVKQITFGDMGLIDTSPSDVEAKRLFRGVLEHCSSIRNAYGELAKRRQVYQGKWAALESEIRQLAPREAAEGFSKSAVFCSLSVAEGNSGPTYDPNGEWLEVKQAAMITGIAQGNPEIRKQVQEEHMGLIERYSQDQRVFELVDMKKAILEQQHKLSDAREDSILRKEYRTTSVKCEFCPR